MNSKNMKCLQTQCVFVGYGTVAGADSWHFDCSELAKAWNLPFITGPLHRLMLVSKGNLSRSLFQKSLSSREDQKQKKEEHKLGF